MSLPAVEGSEVALAERLEGHLRALDSVLVAYSGGVDSAVVLKAATQALGTRALGVLADTESNTDEDVAQARALAAAHGLALEVVAYSELAIERYAANPANRCYFCKNALYERLSAEARRRGVAHVCDGSNADDVGDFRPGLQAVAEHGVRSPLREVGLRKADVRALARHYGLPNHDRPASPCLSSRIPYGSAVTREKLEQVAAAERHLRSLGFVEFRCRHHGEVARLEIAEAEWPRAVECREAIAAGVRAAGFQWVALDVEGFRSGSLNRVLTPGARREHTQASEAGTPSPSRREKEPCP